jgi:hypothetical protein
MVFSRAKRGGKITKEMTLSKMWGHNTLNMENKCDANSYIEKD